MSAIPSLLKRDAQADDISDKPAWRVGISMMASYATGVSLMAGMGIVFSLGLIPGFTWLALNGISLAFWGTILEKYPHAKNWILTLPALLVAVLFGAFGPAFNLSALRSLMVANSGNVASVGFVGGPAAVIGLALLGVGILLYINKYGIRGSVFTDFWQVVLQFTGVVAIIVIGWYLASSNPGSVGFGDNLVLWADNMSPWTAFLAIWPTLISPFLMSMSWQRYQATTKSKRWAATLYASGFFSMYMFLVGIAALVWQPHILMTVAALAVVIGVGTSSLDSAVALHQYVAQRAGLSYKVGTAMSGAAVVSWAGAQTLFPFGVGDLWLFTADIMGPYFIVGMIITTLWWGLNKTAPGLADSIRSATKGWFWSDENVYVFDDSGETLVKSGNVDKTDDSVVAADD